jgi:thiazole/oxazole-forming peptide maturase SagD family component
MTTMTLRPVGRRGPLGIDPSVLAYLDRCVSPLVGPVKGLRVANYDASSRSLITVLPELVELHRRAGVERPDYHLGGFGFRLEESLMKALGESLERSSHFLFHRHNAHLITRGTDSGLRAAGRPHLAVADLGHFSAEQYAQPGCPVVPVDDQTVLSWLPMFDLSAGGAAPLSGDPVLLPAQGVLAGFPTADEPRAFVGITTGSAAHVDYPRALIGALLEMVQVDVTVGHWYSHQQAQRIDVTPGGTPRIVRLLERNRAALDRAGGWCEFYWLPQPEGIPVYVVACAVRRPGRFPAVGIGHGVATDLERAMYRALYEAIPISLVALLQALRALYGDPSPDGDVPTPRAADVRTLFGNLDMGRVTDLEAGVVYYALPEHARRLFPSRFDPDTVVDARDVHREVPPQWRELSGDALGARMVEWLAEHFRLYGMDLTTPDIAQLGLKVVRIYSPDLMALPIPSFPEAAHPRWAAYGRFASAQPHPYP